MQLQGETFFNISLQITKSQLFLHTNKYHKAIIWTWNMGNKKIICSCLVISIALTSGCTSLQRNLGLPSIPKEPIWPWTEEKQPCMAQCEEKDAVKAYASAITYCIELQRYMGQGSGAISSGRFMLATTGTLAGAVFAPLAKGTASTAWSGLSGSTNALQAAVDENFSGVLALKRRASVATAGKDGIVGYPKGGSANDRVYASVTMAFNCAVAPAGVESAAIKAVSEAAVGSSSISSNQPNIQSVPPVPVVPTAAPPTQPVAPPGK